MIISTPLIAPPANHVVAAKKSYFASVAPKRQALATDIIGGPKIGTKIPFADEGVEKTISIIPAHARFGGGRQP